MSCDKRLFVGGNWKMNGSLQKIEAIASELTTLEYDPSKGLFYLFLIV